MDLKGKIEAANQQALEVIVSSRPRWVDVRPAIDVVPGMKENMVLHAGPPISWERMCSAQKKGVMGASIYEGLASNFEEAEAMARDGELIVEPCHEHAAVGSMTGITSASMPVMVVENPPHGNRSFINVHEGPSRERLTYGAFNERVLENLLWIRNVLGPALAEAAHQMGGLEITPIIARSLTMGDECHNRPTAGSALFALKVMPYIIRSELDRETVARISEFLAATEHFFFHLGMAANKAAADAASGIPYCSVVTAMARNGTETGIRVSATGDEWFTGPASSIEGVYFPGYGPDDAEADIGDSAIMETIGLGAFAMGASIPMAQAVGGTAADAIRYQESMADITVGRHSAYQVPALDFQGTPLGIDIRKVVDSGVLPIIDTAIANKSGGEIGVGLARPPLSCFTGALRAFGGAVKAQAAKEAE
ncbi:DUF1116 domain-containing protein [Chloroflexota bacterium]